MATKTSVSLIDDLDGSSVADETVRFAIDGKELEIDLSANHAGVLRDILSDYVNAGRKATTSSNGAKPRGAKPGSNREHLAAVRSWLRQQGHDVKDRGRLPADLVAKFDAAHAAHASQPQQAAPSWA